MNTKDASNQVYLVPGLGFDHRIFEKINFGKNSTCLGWIEPWPDEHLSSYAQRLAAPIPNHSPCVLVGHSLGGILCQEIALYKQVKKIILLSSIKSRKENPLYFKIIKPLLIHRVFSKELATSTLRLWGKYHDYVSQEEQALFKDMILRQSNTYLQWALKQLSMWRESASLRTPIVQIHGSADKTFPIKLIQNPDHTVSGGGHFMVYRRASQVQHLIAQEVGGSK